MTDTSNEKRAKLLKYFLTPQLGMVAVEPFLAVTKQLLDVMNEKLLETVRCSFDNRGETCLMWTQDGKYLTINVVAKVDEGTDARLDDLVTDSTGAFIPELLILSNMGKFRIINFDVSNQSVSLLKAVLITSETMVQLNNEIAEKIIGKVTMLDSQ
jgi:hypothetical protein